VPPTLIYQPLNKLSVKLKFFFIEMEALVAGLSATVQGATRDLQ